MGTPIHVLLLQRLPPANSLTIIDNYRSMSAARAWRSILSLDIAATLVYGLLAYAIGFHALMIVYLPVLVITSWIGGWLFFVQHQFEDTLWKHDGEWDFQEAALHGSSYYALPKILQWFTGNIGLHHIHHLCALIPNYRLQKCMDGRSELQSINRMTFRDSLKCLRWALWDEEKNRMVAFRDLKPAA